MLHFFHSDCLAERLILFLKRAIESDQVVLELVEGRPIDLLLVNIGMNIRLELLVSFLANFLKHLLLIFEQLGFSLAVSRSLRLHEIARHIGVLEYIAAHDDRVGGLLEELQLTIGILLELVQQLHGLPNLVHLFEADLHRLAMVIVSLEMEHVSLQLVFGVLLGLFALREGRVILLALLVEVARVVAAGLRTVLLPWREAQPAEVVLAFLAVHMVTALVLLDVGAALGARLGVGLDPAQVLAVTLLFLQPKVHVVAGRWHMGLLSALDALRRATVALHRVQHAVVADLHKLIAFLVRAPLDIFAIVRELTAMPCHVFLVVGKLGLILHQVQKHRMRYAHIAEGLLAASEHAGLSVRFDLLLQIISPRDGTELVAAPKLQSLVLLVFRVELHVHDGTHIVVFTRQRGVDIFVFLAQICVELETYLLQQLVLISREPRVLEFLLAPLKVAQDGYHVVFVVYAE